MERRHAAILAAAAAAALTALHVVVPVWAGWPWAATAGMGLRGLPLVLALVALPLAGAELLRQDRPVLATALLAALAATSLPPAISSVALLGQTEATPFWIGGALLHLAAYGALVTAAVAASRLATTTSWPARHPVDLLPLLASLAVTVGTVFLPIGIAVAGDHLGPAAWAMPIAATAGDPWGATTSILATLVVGGVLLYAIAVTGRVGAIVVAAAVLPALAGDLGNVVAATRDPDLFVTPVAWVALAGEVVLLALALRWWRAAEPDRAAPSLASAGAG